MKNRNKYIIICLILLLAFVFIIYTNSLESFDTNNNISCYVITLKKPEKMKNIEKQQKKIPYKIQIVDAVLGDELNILDLVKNGTVSLDYSSHDKVRKRQIGCYMSHLKVMDLIKDANNETKYSIVFEDDFNISDNFVNQLNENMDVIDNLDFDILFLGNILSGYNGVHISKNIYGKSDVYGTHGYLIKNENILHIKECMKYVDNNIDLKYTRVPDLKVYLMEPTIVNQLRNEFESEIIV